MSVLLSLPSNTATEWRLRRIIEGNFLKYKSKYCELLSLPVAIAASNCVNVPSVHIIVLVKRGSILMIWRIMNHGRISSFEESLILIVYPLISTQSRSWKPTSGIFPAMIVATCLILQLFLTLYCDAHFSKSCLFKSRHIPFSACKIFSFVNHGFFISAVLHVENSSSLFSSIIADIDSPRIANALILSSSVMGSRIMLLGLQKYIEIYVLRENPDTN